MTAGASREQLETMFTQMTDDAGWDVSQDLLWGYFFTHHTPLPLESAAAELSKIGYEVANIYLSEKEDAAAPDLWWLHVERVEVHSVDSLLARNAELVKFAAQQGLDAYDGMDVGPVGEQ